MNDFLKFLRHFFFIFGLVRHTLAVLLAFMLIGAGVISIAEGMDYWNALYLTMITGLTVGYGDLAPATAVGRIVSVLIGLMGLVLFGVVVAIANRAVAETAKEKRQERDSLGQG